MSARRSVFLRAALVFCAPLVLGGCATAPVKISGDSLCRVVKEDDISWSVGDTKRTIHNLRRLGAKRDRICG